MRVSVVIPTHNRRDGLQAAISSICNQTTKPDEIIVVDDASKVDVRSTLNPFYKDKEIKLIYKRFESNMGGNVARNYGVEISSGDIIMFLDDDDTWEEQKIENQLDTFKKNNDISIVYTGKLVVNEKDRNQVIRKINPRSKGKLYPTILYGNVIGTTSAIAVKKDLFLKVGGFDTELPALQDYDFYIRCGKEGVLFDHDSQCNIRYTIADNPKKQISGSGVKQVVAVNHLLKRHQKLLMKEGKINTKKIKSNWIFLIAKAFHKKDYIKSLKYSIKSFITYPNLKAIALFIPPFLLKK